jgi:hypothetical protein
VNHVDSAIDPPRHPTPRQMVLGAASFQHLPIKPQANATGSAAYETGIELAAANAAPDR